MLNQKGILIIDGTDIKAKIVYGGDTSIEIMDACKAMWETKYPTYTVTIYESDENIDFVNAVVNSPLPVE